MDIPGPRSRELMARLRAVVARGVSVQAPVFADHTLGALVIDVDGNTFIDLSGGIGVLNVGHGAGPVVEAVRDQTGRFLHTDFSVVPYEVYVRLAERLAAVVPVAGDGQRKVCFFNSGAEAVENAVKIARAYSGRKALISFEGGFHGRTFMALALTSKAAPYKEGLGPLAPEVYRVPFAYCYRCPFGSSHDSCDFACAGALERAFVTAVSHRDTAALVFEPVQGEGGFVVPPPGFLPRVQEICRRREVLLIADEIQTGFCRTGRLFASERFGIRPDLICVAKSLAGGLPLSGVAGPAHIMDSPGEGGIGGTYVGNPVACAAALAVLDLIDREDLCVRAERIGSLLVNRLRAMQDRYRIIGDVRGAGAMVAVELVRDRETKEPADRETAHVIGEALRRGVIVPRCGVYNNVIRFLNPLTITDDQLEVALDALEAAIAEADATLAPGTAAT